MGCELIPLLRGLLLKAQQVLMGLEWQLDSEELQVLSIKDGGDVIHFVG